MSGRLSKVEKDATRFFRHYTGQPPLDGYLGTAYTKQEVAWLIEARHPGIKLKQFVSASAAMWTVPHIGTREAAQILGLSVRRVRALAGAGELDHIRTLRGRLYVFSLAELYRYRETRHDT